MYLRFRALTWLMVVGSVAAGCSSGSAIKDTGFIAAPAGHGYTVSFQNQDVRSEDVAKDNLVFHAARFTIDRGDLYFTLQDIATDRKSNFYPVHTKAQPSAMEPDPSATTNPSPTPAPATSHLGTTSAGMNRTASARGFLRTYKVKPEGMNSYEARQVLDELRSAK